jgi:hypothetical protein
LDQHSSFTKKKKFSPDALVLNERDNVGTLVNQAESDSKILLQTVNGELSLSVKDHIDAGHKIALRDFRKGDRVIKFGEIIGEASQDIPAGSHVHSHNMRSLHGKANKK